jgi:hypothetical protein
MPIDWPLDRQWNAGRDEMCNRPYLRSIASSQDSVAASDGIAFRRVDGLNFDSRIERERLYGLGPRYFSILGPPVSWPPSQRDGSRLLASQPKPIGSLPRLCKEKRSRDEQLKGFGLFRTEGNFMGRIPFWSGRKRTATWPPLDMFL